MPYIKSQDRNKFNNKIIIPENSGELNYLITIIIREYIKNNGGNYQAHNDVMGALIGCLLENYRKNTAPYEEIKIKENGDLE